jgi:hypothetical protein
MSEELNFQREAQLEQFNSLMQISALALRSALIINGGSALALLTFLGNMKESSGMVYFVCALKIYIAGVTLAAFAHATSYLAQYRYLNELKSNGAKQKGQYITYASILLVVSSYLAFVFGGLEASSGFSERI